MGRRERRETSEDLIWESLEEACPGCRTPVPYSQGFPCGSPSPLAHPGFIELLRASPGSREKGLWRDRLSEAGQGPCGPPVKTATADRGGPSDPLNHALASRPELGVGSPLPALGPPVILCLGFQTAPPGVHWGETQHTETERSCQVQA